MTNKAKSHGRYHVQPSLIPKSLIEEKKLLNKVWTAKVLTLYPETFPGVLGHSITGRALKNKIWSLEIINIRNFGVGKHFNVDDTPSGGGPGMVLRADVINDTVAAATNNLDLSNKNWPIIYLTPRGKPLTQTISKELATAEGLVILCGRFEGVDERVIQKWNMQEISIGDFVLSGGEIAAQALIDCTVRHIPTVLGNEESIKSESFNNDLLEYPQYTRPTEWNDQKIPEVLLSGHHKKIREWQNQQAIKITKDRRPDLWKKYEKKL
jgi:tRNA (guanine37-N1)-methyltransferase